MRTLVTSPVRSKRRQISTDNELYYEVSPQPRNNNDIKPNTALFSPRQSVISKGKSVVQLYQAKSRILSATQNQRIFSRSKSRNKEGIPLYGSTFSKNCFQGSRSSIDFKTARKYEIEIMELQKEIYAIKEETRDANNKLSQLREEKLQSRNILSNILQSVVTEIKSEIITKKRKYIIIELKVKNMKS